MRVDCFNSLPGPSNTGVQCMKLVKPKALCVPVAQTCLFKRTYKGIMWCHNKEHQSFWDFRRCKLGVANLLLKPS